MQPLRIYLQSSATVITITIFTDFLWSALSFTDLHRKGSTEMCAIKNLITSDSRFWYAGKRTLISPTNYLWVPWPTLHHVLFCVLICGLCRRAGMWCYSSTFCLTKTMLSVVLISVCFVLWTTPYTCVYNVLGGPWLALHAGDLYTDHRTNHHLHHIRRRQDLHRAHPNIRAVRRHPATMLLLRRLLGPGSDLQGPRCGGCQSGGGWHEFRVSHSLIISLSSFFCLNLYWVRLFLLRFASLRCVVMCSHVGMMECNHCAIMRPTSAMHCYECGVCVDHVSRCCITIGYVYFII